MEPSRNRNVRISGALRGSIGSTFSAVEKPFTYRWMVERVFRAMGMHPRIVSVPERGTEAK
jgi:hypothetical protein